VYSVNIDNGFDVDIWSMGYYILDTAYDLIFVHYWWEIALNVGLDESFDNMQDWKGIWEEEEEVI
jgi:hypothetical protein